MKFFSYCCSVTKPCLALCSPVHCSSVDISVLHHLPSLAKLMPLEPKMPSNHLLLYCPLLLLPSVFPNIRVFTSESALSIRWPKYWSFSISMGYSNEYSGLIPFGIDWFDLLAVQGILQSLLQHHSLKALILTRSVFFTVHFSHHT